MSASRPRASLTAHSPSAPAFRAILCGMKNLFYDTRALDAASRMRYELSEELMMENAAAALEDCIQKEAPGKSVLILCGGGNNGADGYALSRRLSGRVSVAVCACIPPKSPLCILQAKRAERVGVPFFSTEELCKSTSPSAAQVIVDCVFGSGFHGSLSDEVASLFTRVQDAKSTSSSLLCISCDVPSGLCNDGSVSQGAFCADITVTMGALKLSLYSDAAKDVAGSIVCADLGISRSLFETSGEKDNSGTAPAAYLLEESDLQLPNRTKNNVHKGSFGHAVIASGEKIGASVIAGTAALRFGAGLVTLTRLGAKSECKKEPLSVPCELMTADAFPEKTTAVAAGMGLGRTESAFLPYAAWLSEHTAVPCVIDADACYTKALFTLLKKRAKGIVLTPHAKELSALLALSGIEGETALSADECIKQRPRLIEAFCRAYPETVLVAKGANPMIGTYSEGKFALYVNPHGSASLAKAGSGDVLAGLIAALLAQGYAPLTAAVQGSLAHALASRAFKNSYALSPLLLLDAVTRL